MYHQTWTEASIMHKTTWNSGSWL